MLCLLLQMLTGCMMLVIRFLLLDNRIRFDINLEAAEQAGLKISSKLLALTQSVRVAPAGGG